LPGNLPRLAARASSLATTSLNRAIRSSEARLRERNVVHTARLPSLSWHTTNDHPYFFSREAIRSLVFSSPFPACENADSGPSAKRDVKKRQARNLQLFAVSICAPL